MKEGWEYKKIKDVCFVYAGQGAPQGEDKYGNIGIPFIKAGNLCDLISGLGESSIPKVTELVADKHKLKLYSAGSVVFAKSGMSCMKGYVYTLKQDCYIVSHLAILQPKYVLSGYLNYYLRYVKPSSLVKDEAYPSISLKDIENLTILMPPPSIQLSIVSELDEINNLLSLKRKELETYDKLAQSLFYEMFGDPVENEMGWEVKKLESICANIVDCPHSTPQKVDYPTPYPCIRTSELRGGSIHWDSMQYLDEDEYKIRIARLKPEPGDIVFGREGTIGDAVILPEGYSFSLGQRTMLLRVDADSVSNTFLHRTILSEWVKSQIRAVNVSSTVAHVNIKDFKQFNIPIPPLPLQQLFAQRIEAIEEQKVHVKAAIEKLETLLAARMQYWFE